MTVKQLIDELKKHPEDSKIAMYKAFQGEELYHPDIEVSMKTLGEDRNLNLRDANYHPDTKDKQNFVCLDYEI